jgi:hypothetical protein
LRPMAFDQIDDMPTWSRAALANGDHVADLGQ